MRRRWDGPHHSAAGFEQTSVRRVSVTGSALGAAGPVSQDPAVESLERLFVESEVRSAAETLVIQLLDLDDEVSRCAAFSYEPRSRQLHPLASRTQTPEAKFYLVKDSLKTACSERRRLITPLKGSAGSGHVAEIPLVLSQGLTLLVHLEFDRLGSDGLATRLDGLERYLQLTQPKFEALSLREGMNQSLVATVKAINAAVEAKDTYTSGHSERVARYCAAIAEQLGFERARKTSLILSALCHDVGKIGVPDAILKKPDLLSHEEFLEMKSHPQIGTQIVSNIAHGDEIVAGVTYHHEKWDGTGYPEGLVGEEIPLFARVIAVADAFDAMTSGRTYAGYQETEEAVAELCEKDDIFDSRILKAFRAAFDQGGLTVRTGTKVRTSLDV